MNRSIEQHTHLLKKLCKEQGFMDVGVAKAEFMNEEAKRLELWLNQGRQGTMQYLENHFDKRVDPTKLVPGAKSVISLTYNYYQPLEEKDNDYHIAMYAQGKDYHKVLKNKLIHIIRGLQEEIGDFSARAFVDSAPVLERDWAVRSGLGWMGKHSLLINKRKGSYFFLAEIICDVEFVFDHPVQDHCGTCTRCIDACPTDAISENGYLIDANKCISYLTIEYKDQIPDEFKGQMGNYIFGCDICQDVCPWNRFSKQHNEPKFVAKEELLNMTKSDWEDLSRDTFQTLFEGSSVKRTKYEGLMRNIRFLSED